MNIDKLRPCVCKVGRISKYVRNANGIIEEEILNPGRQYKGLFHCWVNTRGTPEALVEIEDGKIEFVKPEYIRFTDIQNVNIELDMKEIARFVRKSVNEFCEAYFNLDGD